ncbi:uncharacterized protein V6R79_012494 [Siganus canaliculatus]
MSWRDDEEDFKVGGVRGAGMFKSKPRFSFTEVKLLLEAVKRNRYIILRKFNQGVSAETKKQAWVEITNQINGLGENHREVRQIMKKWADLKCDGKRRIIAMRGPNACHMRKKNLGPVEKMVHKILMMSPRGDGDSDLELEEEDSSKPRGVVSNPDYSYLSLTDSVSGPGGDMSPVSSPDKELSGEPCLSSSEFDLADDGAEGPMDGLEENEDSAFSSSASAVDPLPDDGLSRVKPLLTYSRTNGQNQTCSRPAPPAGPSSGFPPGSDAAAASSSSSSSSSAAPPPPPPESHTSSKSVAANGSTSPPPPPPPPPAPAPPAAAADPSSSSSSDPLPGGASTAAAAAAASCSVAQVASQSLQQQRASRMLLASVSRSLEALAQSVQLLVESQQEFVQESLLLQRETVDVLRDFSNTALTMLRDKGGASGGGGATHHYQPNPRF